MGSRLQLLFGALLIGSSWGQYPEENGGTTTPGYPNPDQGKHPPGHIMNDAYDTYIEIGPFSQMTFVNAFLIGGAGGFEFSKEGGYKGFYSGGGLPSSGSAPYDNERGFGDGGSSKVRPWGRPPPSGYTPRDKFGSNIADMMKDMMSKKDGSGAQFMSARGWRVRPGFPQRRSFDQPGPCPQLKSGSTNTPPLEKILGTWHTSGSTIESARSLVDCAVAELTWDSEDEVINIQANATLFSRIPRSMSLVATLNDQGEMEVSMNGREVVVKNIGTDNENYAVLYSCMETRNKHMEAAFLVTKQPNGFDTYGKKASEDLRNAGVNQELYEVSCKAKKNSEN